MRTARSDDRYPNRGGRCLEAKLSDIEHITRLQLNSSLPNLQDHACINCDTGHVCHTPMGKYRELAAIESYVRALFLSELSAPGRYRSLSRPTTTADFS